MLNPKHGEFGRWLSAFKAGWFSGSSLAVSFRVGIPWQSTVWRWNLLLGGPIFFRGKFAVGFTQCSWSYPRVVVVWLVYDLIRGPGKETNKMSLSPYDPCMAYLPTLVDFYGKCRWIYHAWILWEGDQVKILQYFSSWIRKTYYNASNQHSLDGSRY